MTGGQWQRPGEPVPQKKRSVPRHLHVPPRPPSGWVPRGAHQVRAVRRRPRAKVHQARGSTFGLQRHAQACMGYVGAQKYAQGCVGLCGGTHRYKEVHEARRGI